MTDDYQQLQKLSLSFILNQSSSSPMEEDTPDWVEDGMLSSPRIQQSQPAPTPPPATSTTTSTWQSCSPSSLSTTFFPPPPQQNITQPTLQQPSPIPAKQNPELIPHRRSTFPLFEPNGDAMMQDDDEEEEEDMDPNSKDSYAHGTYLSLVWIFFSYCIFTCSSTIL